MWVRGKTLGRGGFGLVSLAAFTKDGSDVNLDMPSVIAVKSVEFSCSRMLQKERELLAELDGSPHVICCYGADASEEDDLLLYNIFLEYASGGSLRNYIYSGSGLCLDDIRWITKSVLLGLRDIHSKGIVHCDIKPDNILLVGEGGGKSIVKIADLGLAIRQSDRKRKRVHLRGTPVYLAPESILYGEYGFGVDIWALGCCVFEMIVQRPLSDFEGDCVYVDDHLHRTVQLPHGLPKDAEDFLKKSWRKNPELRWTADRLLLHPFVDF